MLASISSYQLSEWMAFCMLEPFGFNAEIYGHGIVASVIANVNRKRGRKAFQPQDFLPREKDRPNKKDFFVNLKTILMLNSKKNNGHNDR
jgi:hypothetical protein